MRELPEVLAESPALKHRSWQRVVRPLEYAIYATVCGYCGVDVPLGCRGNAYLCDAPACRWLLCRICLPKDTALWCPAHLPPDRVHGQLPPPRFLATVHRPTQVPTWAPTWLAFQGRPTGLAGPALARYQRSLSTTPESAQLRVPAAVATEGFRARQRSLCWQLHAYVVATGVDAPDVAMLLNMLAHKAAAGKLRKGQTTADLVSGSTRLSWWFTVSGLVPTLPTLAQTRAYIRGVAATGGLRQPTVAREALAELDVAADAMRTLTTSRTGLDQLAAQRALVAIAGLRGGCRFKTAVDIAVGVWHAPPQWLPEAVVVTLDVEKTDHQRAAVILPTLIPLPFEGLADALAAVRLAAGDMPTEPLAYVAAWRAIYRDTRSVIATVRDIRASRREVGARAAASGGTALAESVLHHRPGSHATPRYTTHDHTVRATARALGAALSKV